MMTRHKSYAELVRDIKVVSPRTIPKGLTSPPDTNLGTVETQGLARGPI